MALNEYERKVPLADTETIELQDEQPRQGPRGAERQRDEGAGLAHPDGRGGRRPQTSPSSLNRIIDVSGPDVFTGIGTFDIVDRRRLPGRGLRRPGGRDARGGVPALRAVDHGAQARRLDARPRTPTTRSRARAGTSRPRPDPTPADWVLPAHRRRRDRRRWRRTPTGSRLPVDDDTPDRLGRRDHRGGPGQRAAGLRLRRRLDRRASYRTPGSADDGPLAGRRRSANGFTATVTERVDRHLPDGQPRPPAPGDHDREVDQRRRRRRRRPARTIPVGDPVAWTYVVTNTGNDTLGEHRRSATTSGRGRDLPAATTLGAGRRNDVRGQRRRPRAGQYANLGSVTAVDPFGTRSRRQRPVALRRGAPRDRHREGDQRRGRRGSARGRSSPSAAP